MNPLKVDRAKVKQLTDLPNVGEATATDLRLLGIENPSDLMGLNPYTMYEDLCSKTGLRHDPCVIDVFISITRFIHGEAAQPWWHYTPERKASSASGVSVE